MDESTWRMLCLVVLVAPALRIASAEEIKLSMPSVQPQQNDLYLCIDKKIDDLKYITGFKPTASMQVAHHILIYGCSEPGGSGGSPWNCGEMHQDEKGMFQSGPVCKDSGRIIYAWAMDAPELTLPNDVAFKIGGETAMKYLVMQVHYKDVTRFLPPSLEKDNSGVTLTATDIPRAKTAGVYLVAANGKLSPRSVTYMEAACSFQEALTLHPFAYRVHSHKLGKVVSGYRVRDGEWTEIGRMSPQKPQMFYPVEDSQLEINPGDIIAARCTMENKGHKTVAVGPTSDDEMCNFYIMYYVSGDQDVKDPICTSPGPPHWNWKFFDGIHAENAPPQASADPETNDWFEETKQFINNVHETLTRENENLRKHLDDTFKNLWSSKPIVPKFEFPSQSFASPNFASEFSSPNFANPKFASEFADPNFASPKFPSAFSSLNFPSPKFPSDLFSDSSYADTYDNGFKSYGQPDYDGYNVENNDYLNGEQQFGFYQKPENPSGPHLFTNFKVQEIPGGSSYSSRRIKFNRQNNKGLGYFSRAGSEQKRFPAFEAGDDDSSDDDAIKLNFPKMPSAKPIPKMENLQLVFPKMPEVQKIRKLPKIMVNNENDGNHTEHANKGNLTRTEESGHVPPADDGYENIPSAEDTPEVEEIYSNEIPSEEGDSEVDVEESEEESDRIEPKIASESKDAAGFSKDDPFAPKVQSSEILHTFDDKQGGKGYSSSKVENSYQELNIPGGKGFVKSHSRSKAAGYHKSKTTVT